MSEADSWASEFFSGEPPEFIRAAENSPNLRKFFPDTDKWDLGGLVDKTRPVHGNRIQVFWLRRHGRRKYVAKVFPEYTPEQAKEQLRRFRIPESLIRSRIDKAVGEFDSFLREARAYGYIEKFCPSHERIYFPQFHGALTDLQKSSFSSGYPQKRALVLEAITPTLRSRRILAMDISLLPNSFKHKIGTLRLSLLEREWYCSLLCDRLRRLAALHRIGVTHGDIQDCHFRLPGDLYDTVLFDFSESYTFSPEKPFRVNSGRPRPLGKISEGERMRVELQVSKRAAARDFRSYLGASIAEHILDDALWQPLDMEKGLLEAIVLKARSRPDYFSMPSLNSVFPFLEAIRPKSDPTWHIRRGRLLNHYESVWASISSVNDCLSIALRGEPAFEALEPNCHCYLLCLVPRTWNTEFDSKDTKVHDKLRQAFSLLASSRSPGYIIKHREFFEKGD